MTIEEDRSHRSYSLNPRNHPVGNDYPDQSKRLLWRQLADIALLSDPEKRFIQDVPRILGAGNYANLGHSRGGSAILLADGLREHKLNGKIYSIDLFPATYMRRRARRNINRFEVKPWIELCYGSTDKWAKRLHDTAFNFLFIDADHTYEAVIRDFNNWSPLVKEGGWVSFHDTDQDFSHRAIEDTVANTWKELTNYHIHRIRTFQKSTPNT